MSKNIRLGPFFLVFLTGQVSAEPDALLAGSGIEFRITWPSNSQAGALIFLAIVP